MDVGTNVTYVDQTKATIGLSIDECASRQYPILYDYVSTPHDRKVTFTELDCESENELATRKHMLGIYINFERCMNWTGPLFAYNMTFFDKDYDVWDGLVGIASTW